MLLKLVLQDDNGRLDQVAQITHPSITPDKILAYLAHICEGASFEIKWLGEDSQLIGVSKVKIIDV